MVLVWPLFESLSRIAVLRAYRACEIPLDRSSVLAQSRKGLKHYLGNFRPKVGAPRHCPHHHYPQGSTVLSYRVLRVSISGIVIFVSSRYLLPDGSNVVSRALSCRLTLGGKTSKASIWGSPLQEVAAFPKQGALEFIFFRLTQTP